MFDDVIWDKLNEECGVFGVYGHPDASQLTYYGIHSLQHRERNQRISLLTEKSSLTIAGWDLLQRHLGIKN